MSSDELDYRDHWEALFDKQYMRWFDLMNHEVSLTIDKVERGIELTMRGGTKKKGTVVHFKPREGKGEAPKPLVLNVTNAETIASIHGKKPSQWVGKQIVLYPTTTRMYRDATKKMETVGCIRIKAPATKSSGK